MASYANTSSLSVLYDPTITAIYFNWLKGWEEVYSDFMKVNQTFKAYEKESTFPGLPPASTKTEGGPVTQVDIKTGYTTTYTLYTYGISWGITQEMHEDDQTGIIGAMPKAAAWSMAYKVETVAATIFNNAWTTGTGGDSVYLASASHPLAYTGGTYGNRPNAGESLSLTALWNGRYNLLKTVNDNNMKTPMTPMYLVTGPDLEQTAIELLGSAGQPENGNNTVNAIRKLGIKHKINPFLTSTTQWYLQCDEHQIKMFWRRYPDWQPDTDVRLRTALYTTTMRLSTGWTDWRGYYQGNS